MLDVRPIHAEEYEEAGRVTALAYEEFAVPGDPSWDEYLRRLADIGPRAGRALVLVAVEEDRLLGTATLELDQRIDGGHERDPLPPGEAHIRMLGVDPGARHRGIGRRLVEGCIEESKRAGKQILTLGTTQKMVSAQKMYESLGFRRGPDQVFDDGFRLLTYELPLSAA
jgi:ribosomal protein S18 acetylase RimI-like enzyme